MEKMLLKKTDFSINATETSIDHLSIDILLQNHRNLLMNGGTTENKTKDLVEIMGGMDAILSDYLQHKLDGNVDVLSQDTLHKINQILLSSKFESTDTNNNSLKVLKSLDSPILELTVEDSLIYKILGKSITTRKIKQLLLSNFVEILMLLFTISCIVMYCLCIWFTDIISKGLYNAFCIYQLFVMFCVFIYLMLGLSFLNITAFKAITSFGNLFKLIYFIRGYVCWNIYQTRIISKNKSFELGLPVQYISSIIFLLFMIVYSYIDGFYIPSRYKMIMAICGAMVIAISTIVFTYTEFMVNDDERYLTLMYHTKIDLVSWTASSFRVVCIFAWKQSIYTIWKPYQSTLMQKSVMLKWTRS